MTFTEFEKPDGKIHFCASSCCCGPDSKKPPGAIHTCGFTWWVKLERNDPEAKAYPWTRVLDLALMKHLGQQAGTAATVQEFFESNFTAE